MKRIIQRGSGFLRRNKRSRNPPTVTVYRGPRLRHPTKSDTDVSGVLR